MAEKALVDWKFSHLSRLSLFQGPGSRWRSGPHQITRDLSPLKASLKGRFTASDKLGARLHPNINWMAWRGGWGRCNQETHQRTATPGTHSPWLKFALFAQVAGLISRLLNVRSHLFNRSFSRGPGRIVINCNRLARPLSLSLSSLSPYPLLPCRPKNHDGERIEGV